MFLYNNSSSFHITLEYLDFANTLLHSLKFTKSLKMYEYEYNKWNDHADKHTTGEYIFIIRREIMRMYF